MDIFAIIAMIAEIINGKAVDIKSFGLPIQRKRFDYVDQHNNLCTVVKDEVEFFCDGKLIGAIAEENMVRRDGDEIVSGLAWTSVYVADINGLSGWRNYNIR